MADLMSLLSSPQMAMAAGLLNPQGTYGNFGASLGNALQSGMQAQQMQSAQQIQAMQMSAMKKKMEEAEEQAKRKKQQQVMAQKMFARPELQGPRRPQFQGQALLGESQFEQDPNAAMGSLLGVSDDPLTQAISLINATKQSQPSTSQFERIDERVQAGIATPGEIAWHKKQLESSPGMTVDLRGILGREDVKADVKAREETIASRGNLAGSVGLLDQMIQRVSAPGATVGAASALVRGLDVVKSQAQQILSDPEAFSQLSPANVEAIQAGEIQGDTISLAFAIASQREGGGKLTDRDIKAAKDTFESGSIPQMVAKLANVRNNSIERFNRTAGVNRSSRERFGEAFSPFDAPPIYGAENIMTMDAGSIASMSNMGLDVLKRILSPEEQEAFAARRNALLGGQ